MKSEREVAQLCLTLREPKDCRLPGSSIHGIFQARVREWGAIAFFLEMPKTPTYIKNDTLQKKKKKVMGFRTKRGLQPYVVE